jgi:hypothetical protein
VDDVNANDLVAFAVEVVAFVSLGIWGWQHGFGDSSAGKWVAMLGVLAVAVALWALFVSPQSVVTVPALGVVLKVVILGCGVLSLGTIAATAWAVAFGLFAAANTVLIHVGPFAR